MIIIKARFSQMIESYACVNGIALVLFVFVIFMEPER